MNFDRKDLPDGELLRFYKTILLPRMIEEKMLLLLRQGKISKWFSGMGQEAISTGVTLALEDDEWIMPLHRNLGVFTTRQMPLNKLLKQWLGSKDGYSKGRERSFHFGSAQDHICGMISHLGPQLAIADGVALANKLRGTKKIAVAFTGEGATSEGDFHEALNIAAVWDLPVIFIIENNGYGLSTPSVEQYRCGSLVDRAQGYGMGGIKIDGNNLLTVYDTVKGVRDYCIKHQKPYLIECTTFRMRGHEEASGVKYIPRYFFEIWAKKDPVLKFEEYLMSSGVLTEAANLSIREELSGYIELELIEGFLGGDIIADTSEELKDIYAANQGRNEDKGGTAHIKSRDADTALRYIDAIKEALHQSMQRHEDLILMGQDIAEYGGAFKITEGFAAEFGKDRVRNTLFAKAGLSALPLA